MLTLDGLLFPGATLFLLAGVVFTMATLPTDLDAAWNDLHDARPPGWYVGRPSYDERYQEWVMYAFDPTEPPQAGHRSPEWTAVAESETEVVREMARCLRLIGEGRVPE